jgi:hypothetical protein
MQALPATTEPVLIRSCMYWRAPPFTSRAAGGLQTLGVRIEYENLSDRPITGVTFLIKTDIFTEDVTDTGLFSPRVDIAHNFYTTYKPYYEAKTSPDICRVVRVRFAGSQWQQISE